MNKIKDIPFNKSSSRKEDINPQREFDGVTVVTGIQNIEEQRVLYAKPTVVEEGLLLPFTYIKTIQNNNPVDMLCYMLIDKSTIKEAIDLIKDYDDGK